MHRSFVALAALVLQLGAACQPAASSPAPRATPAPPAASTSATPAAAAPAAPTAVAPVTVAVAHLPASAFDWPAYVAEEKGFFRAQGIELDRVQIGTPNDAARAVVSNSTQVGWFSLDAAVRATEGGGDLVVVGSSVSNPAFGLVVQPEVREFSDMRGKSVAVGTPKDGAAVILRLMMRARGLNDGEYEFASVGAAPNRYTALKTRAADGAVLAHPLDLAAVDEGYRLLGRSSDVIRDYLFMAVAANRSWAREQRPVLVRYLRALGAAIDWLYDPANRDEAIDILVARMNTPRDAVVRTYALYVEEAKIYPRYAEVPAAGLDVFLKAMIELDDLPGPTADPARYVELSFVREARQ